MHSIDNTGQERTRAAYVIIAKLIEAGDVARALDQTLITRDEVYTLLLHLDALALKLEEIYKHEAE